MEEGRTFKEDEFHRLLDLIRELPPKEHQDFGFAFEHYARALRELGADEEMVFVRLVSAVEALSKEADVSDRDFLHGRTFEELVPRENLSDEEYSDLKGTFDVRRSKARFQKFLDLYCEGFFSEESGSRTHVSIARRDLEKVTSAIYDARSSSLHYGDRMYLSM